ncbi:MAG: chromosomal replication initiator protein DnaA [Patescibacteria group bacterium]|nr:chromosomal replication initiator protein DnaA [Patescibacteria group bacterium]
MNDEFIKLWDIVLGEVQTEISAANFHTLFKKTKLFSLENNIATIAVPSAMIIDLLEKRFLLLIKKTLEKHTGQNIQIIFIPKVFEEKIEKQDGPLFFEEEKKLIGHLPRVRPDFTFQNLAVSSSNQLAYVSCQTVSKNIGAAYNPLFIYGPVGVGKTHLMQAIANDVYEKDPNKKIVYITSEEFTNEVVEAIRTNNTHKMKTRFRSCALLLIDDVQFLAGKEKVQEELFHTFNILIDKSSQIVLSSDRPPHEIKKLEKRLSSRFSGGLTVDIEAPDFELKTAILLIKAKKYNVEIPIEIAKLVAEKTEDVRKLEGTLLRIITESESLGEEINLFFVEKILEGKFKKEEIHPVYPDQIIKNVCTFYNIKPNHLKGPRRNASLVKARQVSMYILKKKLDLTLVEIGNFLGGRDHTTIMHGVEKIEGLLSTKPSLNEEILRITKFING